MSKVDLTNPVSGSDKQVHTNEDKSQFIVLTHWVGGLIPLLFTLGLSIALVSQWIHPHFWSVISFVFISWVVGYFSYEVILDPHYHLKDAEQIIFPLFWSSYLWFASALSIDFLPYFSFATALTFGMIVALSPLYLQPFIIIYAFLLEIALQLYYIPHSVDRIIHASFHAIACILIPRLINPKEFKRFIYPRRLEYHELPLSHRQFVPELHQSEEHLSVNHSSNVNQTSLSPKVTFEDDPFDPHLEESFLNLSSSLKASSDPSLPFARPNSGDFNPTLNQSIDPELTPPMHHSTDATPAVQPLPSGEHPLGFLTQSLTPLKQIHYLADLESLAQQNTQKALKFIKHSFDVQLSLLRQLLALDTAVVLWRKTEGTLAIRAKDSDRPEWIEGDYDIDYGLLPDALKGTLVISDPVEASLIVPYYDRRATLGAFMACPIYLQHGVAQGVLCVDRSTSLPWEPGDQGVVEHTAQKLALDIQTGRLLNSLTHDRFMIGKLWMGLRRLNETLDLEGVTNAALFSLQVHQVADFISVCVTEEEGIRVYEAWVRGGPDSTDFEQRAPSFPEAIFLHHSQSLITHTLEQGSQCYKVPLHQIEHIFPMKVDELHDMESALIYPLRSGQKDVLGVLVLASRSLDAFKPLALNPLEMTIEQIETKLALSRAHEQLREAASRDGLTGLKNHITFQSSAANMLQRAQRLKQNLIFILLDIDHFKKLNDTYGHPFGDQVLKKVAHTLTLDMREVDLVARYGGEEFAIALEGTHLEGGLLIAERIRKRIENLTFEYQDQEVKVSISLGVACFPEDGFEKDHLMEQADKALYHSKRSGRNQVSAWCQIEKEDQSTSVGWTRVPMAFLHHLDSNPIVDRRLMNEETDQELLLIDEPK